MRFPSSLPRSKSLVSVSTRLTSLLYLFLLSPSFFFETASFTQPTTSTSRTLPLPSIDSQRTSTPSEGPFNLLGRWFQKRGKGREVRSCFITLVFNAPFRYFATLSVVLTWLLVHVIARTEQALNRRALATGLLGLITSKPIGSKAQHKHAAEPGDSDDDEDGEGGEGRGLMNSEGAWCWREGCDGEFAAFVSLSSGFERKRERADR